MLDFEKQIHGELNEIEKMLLAKNKAYGNSALSPCRVFSKASVKEQLLVRIDDKLSRIRNIGFGDNVEDTVKDLIGYLVLLRLAMKGGGDGGKR